MLLRRITAHIQSQNWTAVFLDFLIVVVGVFIGIQVANWNEAVAQRKRDEVLLERLRDDFVDIVAYGEKRLPLYRSSAARVSELISTLRSGSDPGLTEEFQAQIDASVVVWAASETSPTYDELLATGALSRIRNLSLRTALNDYSRAREADHLLLVEGLDKRYEGVIEQAIRFRPAQSYDPRYVVDSYDWEKLRAVEPDLQTLLRYRTLRILWWERQYSSAKTVLNLIEEELNGVEVASR